MLKSVEAERDQHRRERRIARDLAAQAHRLARAAAIVDHPRQQAQQRGMQRVVERAERIVVAIGGEHVLREVVGADREKVRNLQHLAHADHRRRHLDHRAEFELVGDFVTLGTQVARAAVHQRAHGLHFGGVADHRHQDTHRSVAGRAQDRAQLHREYRGMAQRQTHAAHAQRGIRFRRQHQAGAVGLVRAEVERADRHRQSAHREHGIAIGGELFFLVRQMSALEEQEFGAVEADAAGAQSARLYDF